MVHIYLIMIKHKFLRPVSKNSLAVGGRHMQCFQGFGHAITVCLKIVYAQENHNQRGTTAPAAGDTGGLLRAAAAPAVLLLCQGPHNRPPNQQRRVVTRRPRPDRSPSRLIGETVPGDSSGCLPPDPKARREANPCYQSDLLGCDGNADAFPRSQTAAETTHSYACTYCKYLLAFLR